MLPVVLKLTMLVTVSIVLPESPLEGSVALIVLVPALAAVAKPVVTPMLATAVLDEVQFTLVVRSFVLWSLKTPVAVNCCVTPLVTAVLSVAFWGAKDMEVRVRGVDVDELEELPPPQPVLINRPIMSPMQTRNLWILLIVFMVISFSLLPFSSQPAASNFVAG
jgi:hypothetical protein